MNRYLWNDSLSVGIREIDGQHQELLKAIYGLNQRNATVAGNDIKIRCIELIDQIITHFKTEERYFEIYRYPDEIIHREQHDIYLMTIKGIQKQLSDESSPIPVEELQLWVTDHIQNWDKKYSAFLISKGLF